MSKTDPKKIWAVKIYLKYEKRIPIKLIAISTTAIVIANALILRAFVEYYPILNFGVTLLAAVISIVFGLGFFSDAFSSSHAKYSKIWRRSFRVSTTLIVIFLFALALDSDGNKISNYTEISHGLNPFIQNTEQNEDAIRMSNLIDGCIIEWARRGRKIDYSKLPADSDADGCFDEVETKYGSVVNSNFVPGIIHTQHTDPYNAYVDGLRGSTNAWEIKINTGTLLNSQNLIEFVWDRFVFNNGKSAEKYKLVLTLNTHDRNDQQQTKIISFDCIDTDASQSPKVVRCKITDVALDQVKKFLFDYDNTTASWQASIGEYLLFSSQGDHNDFNITLAP